MEAAFGIGARFCVRSFPVGTVKHVCMSTCKGQSARAFGILNRATSHAKIFVRQMGGRGSPLVRDTIIFSSDRTQLFRLMSVTAVSQCVFWVFVATFALDYGKEDTDEGQSAPLSTLALRYGFFTGALAVAGAMIALGAFIPSRYVHTLTALENGKAVRLGTYRIIGTRELELPLQGLKFSQSASKSSSEGTSPSYTIAAPGYSGFFFLDGTHGSVVNPRIFNWVARQGL
eukprot:m.62539 g.62539  ORF g.62539 m.62539 type:complete len:230 (-) comp11516_c0_seq1:1751-2440(-)